MEKSRMSKHDTREVLRNKHNGLIELLGLYSSPWLYNGKHARQTKILITGGAGCCRLSKAAQNNVSSLYITRQKAQMMHLACHCSEKFLLFETASFSSFGQYSELFNSAF